MSTTPVTAETKSTATATKPVVTAEKKAAIAATKKSPATKVAKVKAPKVPVAKKPRTRFYMIALPGTKFAVLSPKATSATEALSMVGVKGATVLKELATNRHLAVVEFCDAMDAVPSESTAAPVVAKTPATV